MTSRSSVALIVFLLLLCAIAPTASAADNPAIPAATDASTAGLDHLRAAIRDAYNKGDIDAMTRYLHPDVVIVFPDGSILKGPNAFREYYKKMMTEPNHRVVSYSADPQVESRTVHNDVGLSYGYMNDKYTLNDGRSFELNSRFTVTVFKSPDGPPDTNGWMIRSFHSSADTFDNPIIKMVAQSVFWRAGIGGAALGLIIGLLIGVVYARTRKQVGIEHEQKKT